MKPLVLLHYKISKSKDSISFPSLPLDLGGIEIKSTRSDALSS